MKKNMKRLFFLFAILSLGILVLSSCSWFEKESAEDGRQNNAEKVTYDVSNEYFTYISFVALTFTNESGFVTNTIRIKTRCSVSLIEYTADVTFYSGTGKKLKTDKVSKTENIAAKTEFYFDIIVDLDTAKFTNSVSVTYSGKTYDVLEKIQKEYSVTLVYNNGSPNRTIKVIGGNTLTTPTDPKKTNFLFKGWYTDEEFKNKYDFSKAVTKDFYLYAAYEIDAVSITNDITRNKIHSIVKIYNKSYNSFLGIEYAGEVSQGSGFCFYASNDNYYFLTNCHVVKKNDSYNNQKITVEDYLGNTYDAYIYKNPNKSLEAIDASYDLACIYIKASSTKITPIYIENKNPAVTDDIIALGSPQNQSNSITFGKVEAYTYITLNADPKYTNVKFQIIQHSAWVDHGSSGGPLLNSSLHVIGVNYAVSQGSQSNDYRSYAIPATKIEEFLNKYVYN